VSVSCPDDPVNESTSTSLECSASSKPASQFTWAHSSEIRNSSQGPVGTNRYVFRIDSVDKTHFGQYTCTASNGIRSDGTGSCKVSVNCTCTLINDEYYILHYIMLLYNIIYRIVIGLMYVLNANLDINRGNYLPFSQTKQHQHQRKYNRVCERLQQRDVNVLH